MRLLGKALIALAMAGGALIIGAPAQSAELKAEGSIPGLSVVVQDLKRDEANSVTLRFQLVNASDKSVGISGKFHQGASDGDQISGVHLIDNVNKKKYLVVRDTNKKCACSSIHNIEKGGRANLWAKFAAPPENVEKMTVVVPDFQPIDSVPITR